MARWTSRAWVDIGAYIQGQEARGGACSAEDPEFGFGGPFDDVGDGPVREAGGGDVAVAVDGPEDRSPCDRGEVEPAPQGGDRAGLGVGAVGEGDLSAFAFLVGLGAAQGDPDAFVSCLEVADVEGDQFGAAERPGEADEEQGLVTAADRAVGEVDAARVEDPLAQQSVTTCRVCVAVTGWSASTRTDCVACNPVARSRKHHFGAIPFF